MESHEDASPAPPDTQGIVRIKALSRAGDEFTIVGTGFRINADAFITAAHVLTGHDGEELFAEADGKNFPVKSIFRESNLDFALLTRPSAPPNSIAPLLNSIVSSFGQKAQASNDPRDQERSASLQREALATLPPGDPDRPAMLSNLAAIIRSQYDLLGDPGQLDEAGYLLREALATLPPGDPDRPAMLTNLAAIIRSQYDLLGDPGQLDEAGNLLREALATLRSGHPSRPAMLSNLAAIVLAQFELLGDTGQLEEAKELLRAALQDAPERAPLRTLILKQAASVESARGDPGLES